MKLKNDKYLHQVHVPFAHLGATVKAKLIRVKSENR